MTGPDGDGSVTAGLLAVCLNLPHLVGPVLARGLDRRRDARPLLASCCAIYGIAVAGSALVVGHAPLAVTLGLVVVAGTCGPILTGGLSSRLGVMLPDEERLRRRAQGLDALTYGAAGTVGPALVAVLASTVSPLVAVLALSASSVFAAALVLTLPAGEQGQVTDQPALGPREAAWAVVVNGGLRRALLATVITAFVTGTTSIFAVGLGLELTGEMNNGAVLVALFGGGNLAGSALMAVHPSRSEPDRSILRFAFLIGAAFVVAGVAVTFWVAAIAFTLAGVLNGPFFAATLAARTSYSPAGGRAQVFVLSAAIKIAASAAGAAAAGALGFPLSRPALIAGGVISAVVVLLLAIDRRRHPASERLHSIGAGQDSG